MSCIDSSNVNLVFHLSNASKSIASKLSVWAESDITKTLLDIWNSVDPLLAQETVNVRLIDCIANAAGPQWCGLLTADWCVKAHFGMMSQCTVDNLTMYTMCFCLWWGRYLVRCILLQYHTGRYVGYKLMSRLFASWPSYHEVQHIFLLLMVSCILPCGLSCSCTVTGAAMYNGYVTEMTLYLATGFGVSRFVCMSLACYRLSIDTSHDQLDMQMYSQQGRMLSRVATIRLAKL